MGIEIYLPFICLGDFMDLCENGTYLNNGVCHRLICNINNKDCCFIRWCITDRCLKMTGQWATCKNKNKENEVK
jgi:hypothetical protein